MGTVALSQNSRGPRIFLRSPLFLYADGFFATART